MLHLCVKKFKVSEKVLNTSNTSTLQHAKKKKKVNPCVNKILFPPPEREDLSLRRTRYIYL